MIRYLLALGLSLSSLWADNNTPSNTPTWKRNVPSPVFEAHPDYEPLYWAAWEQAHGRVKSQPGLPQSPYMDEACWDSHIWIWDTAFMAFFTKYSPTHFPGVESLKNFYSPMHDGSEKLPLRIQHPDNPPLFAWAEYANWKFNGATSHGSGKDAAIKSLSYLKKHYAWFNQAKNGQAFGGAATVFSRVHQSNGQVKGFTWNGVASGMDNTPRGRGAGQGNTLWIDAISQQALSALYISRLANDIGDTLTDQEYQKKYKELKNTINSHYWDDQDQCYYDIHRNSTVGKKNFIKVLTPASIWPLLAEVADQQQASAMAKLLNNPHKLGAPSGGMPIVTLSRDDPQFNGKTGDYWKGGVWMPTSYMTIKALEKYGMQELADELASRSVEHMLKTWHNPAAHKLFKGRPTIWECYNPNTTLPSTEHGRTARPEFCGWSALGPISLFIENVLGFHAIDARKKEIHWRKRQPGLHGIRNLKFGNITTTILAKGKSCTVQSTAPYTLIVNGEKLSISKGINTFGSSPPEL